MQRRAFVALLFVSLTLGGCAADDDRRGELDAEFRALAESVCTETGTPGVTVHVLSPEHGEFSFAWGLSDTATDAPLTADQPLRVGSLTKSFTGAAVLALAADGALDLDAPISDYLGLIHDYQPLGQVSVRQLLNMSSGLAEYSSVPFLTGVVIVEPLAVHTPSELLAVAFAESDELLFAPGENFHYTNTNYILLGLLIEEVSGKRYDRFVADTFLGPLGLEQTRVVLDGELPAGLAHGYFDTDEDGAYEDWTAMDMSYVWAAGCIVSTAADIARWMEAVASGSLVSEEMHGDLFGGQAMAEGVTYGAGVLVDEAFGVGHNGTVIGYHADAWYDPTTGATVAVLSNTNSPLLDDERDATREIAEGILTRLRD